MILDGDCTAGTNSAIKCAEGECGQVMVSGVESYFMLLPTYLLLRKHSHITSSEMLRFI